MATNPACYWPDPLPGSFDRGVQITSSRPGTLPLLLLGQDSPVFSRCESQSVLAISVARPEMAVAQLGGPWRSWAGPGSTVDRDVRG